MSFFTAPVAQKDKAELADDLNPFAGGVVSAATSSATSTVEQIDLAAHGDTTTASEPPVAALEADTQPLVKCVAAGDAAVTKAVTAAARRSVSGHLALDAVYDVDGGIRPSILGASRCFRVMRVGWTSNTAFELVLTANELLLLPLTAHFAVAPPPNMAKAVGWKSAWQMHDDPGAAVAAASGAGSMDGGGITVTQADKDKGMCRWTLAEVLSACASPKHEEDIVLSVGPPPTPTSSTSGSSGSAGWFGTGGTIAGTKKENVTLRCRFRPQLLSAIARACDDYSKTMRYTSIQSALAAPLHEANRDPVPAPKFHKQYKERRSRQYVAVRRRRGGLRRWKRVLLEVSPFALHQVTESFQRIGSEVNPPTNATDDAPGAEPLLFTEEAVYPYLDMQRLGPVMAHSTNLSATSKSPAGSRPTSPTLPTNIDINDALADDAQVDGVLAASGGGLIVIGHKGRLTLLDIVGSASDSTAFDDADAIVEAAFASARTPASGANVSDTQDFSSSRVRAAASALVTHEGLTRAQARAAKAREQLLSRARAAAFHLGVPASKVGGADVAPISLGSVLAHWKRYRAAVSGQPVQAAFEVLKYSARQCGTIATRRLLIITPRFMVERSVDDVGSNDTESIVSAARFESVYAFVRVGTAVDSACTERYNIEHNRADFDINNDSDTGGFLRIEFRDGRSRHYEVLRRLNFVGAVAAPTSAALSNTPAVSLSFGTRANARDALIAAAVDAATRGGSGTATCPWLAVNESPSGPGSVMRQYKFHKEDTSSIVPVFTVAGAVSEHLRLAPRAALRASAEVAMVGGVSSLVFRGTTLEEQLLAAVAQAHEAAMMAGVAVAMRAGRQQAEHQADIKAMAKAAAVQQKHMDSTAQQDTVEQKPTRQKASNLPPIVVAAAAAAISGFVPIVPPLLRAAAAYNANVEVCGASRALPRATVDTALGAVLAALAALAVPSLQRAHEHHIAIIAKTSKSSNSSPSAAHPLAIVELLQLLFRLCGTDAGFRSCVSIDIPRPAVRAYLAPLAQRQQRAAARAWNGLEEGEEGYELADALPPPSSTDMLDALCAGAATCATQLLAQLIAHPTEHRGVRYWSLRIVAALATHDGALPTAAPSVGGLAHAAPDGTTRPLARHPLLEGKAKPTTQQATSVDGSATVAVASGKNGAPVTASDTKTTADSEQNALEQSSFGVADQGATAEQEAINRCELLLGSDVLLPITSASKALSALQANAASPPAPLALVMVALLERCETMHYEHGLQVTLVLLQTLDSLLCQRMVVRPGDHQSPRAIALQAATAPLLCGVGRAYGALLSLLQSDAASPCRSIAECSARLMRAVVASAHEPTANHVEPREMQQQNSAASGAEAVMAGMLRGQEAAKDTDTVGTTETNTRCSVSGKPIKQVQAAALSSGLLLEHLGVALALDAGDNQCGPSAHQRAWATQLSRRLVATWCTDHSDAHELLARVLPTPILAHLYGLSPSVPKRKPERDSVAADVTTQRCSNGPNGTPSQQPAKPQQSEGSLRPSLPPSSRSPASLQPQQHSEVQFDSVVAQKQWQISVGGETGAVSAATNVDQVAGAMADALSSSGKPVVADFGALFSAVERSHRNIWCHWGAETRRELREALNHESTALASARQQQGGRPIAWNHRQFRCQYPSLCAPRAFLCAGCVLLCDGDKSNQEGTLLGLPAPLLKLELDALAFALPPPASAPRRFLSMLLNQGLSSFGAALAAADDAANEWCSERDTLEHHIHSSSTMCAACLRTAAAIYRNGECASSAGALGINMLEQLIRGLSRCHAASAGVASLTLFAVTIEIDLCTVFVELLAALLLTPIEHIALAHAERILSLSVDGGVGNLLDILTQLATSEMLTKVFEAGVGGAAVWRGVWARELSATRHRLQQHYAQLQQQNEAAQLQEQGQGQVKESGEHDMEGQTVQQSKQSTLTEAGVELELAAPLLGHGPFTVVELRQLLEQAALETGQSRDGLAALVTPACALMVRLEDGSNSSSAVEAQAVAAGGTGRWCPLAAMPTLRRAAFGLKPSAAPKMCTSVLERLFSCQSGACLDAKARDRVIFPLPRPFSALSTALDTHSTAARVLPRLVRLMIVLNTDIVASAARSLHLVATLSQAAPTSNSAQGPSATLFHLLRHNAVPLMLIRLLEMSRVSCGSDEAQNNQAPQATLALARMLALVHTAVLPAAKHVHNTATSVHASVTPSTSSLTIGTRAAALRESDARAKLMQATQRVASAAWAWDPAKKTANTPILQSLVIDNAREIKAEAAALVAAATMGRKHGAILSLAELVSGTSALRPLLPPPLLLLLSTAGESASEDGAAQFVRAFAADSATPALIWNGHMRDTLYRALQSHLQKCFLCVKDDDIGKSTDIEDKTSTHASDVRAILAQAPDAPLQILPMEPLEHEELRGELWCCGLFLKCLCFGVAKTADGSTQRFADHWGITDPLGLSAAVQGRLAAALKSAHQDDSALWARITLYLHTLLILYTRSDTAYVIADAAAALALPLGATEAAVAAAATTTGAIHEDTTVFAGDEFSVPATSLGTALPFAAANGIFSSYKILLALAFGAETFTHEKKQQASLLARKVLLASISRVSSRSSAADLDSKDTRIMERAQLANAAALVQANGATTLVTALAAAADALEAEGSKLCGQYIATAEAAAKLVAALGRWPGGRTAFATETSLPCILARLLQWAAICPSTDVKQGAHDTADTDHHISGCGAELAISHETRSPRLAAAVLRVAAVLAGHSDNACDKHDASSKDVPGSHLQTALARSALPWLGLLLCTRYQRSEEHSEVEAARRALQLNGSGPESLESTVGNFAGGPLALPFDYLHYMTFEVGSENTDEDSASNSIRTSRVQTEAAEGFSNKLARLSARMLGRIGGLLGRDGANTMNADVAAEELATKFALSQRTPRFLPLVLALRSLLGGCPALVDGGLGATDVTPFLRVLCDARSSTAETSMVMGTRVGTESPFLIFNASIYEEVVSFCRRELEAITKFTTVTEIVTAADNALHRARVCVHPSLAPELRLNGIYVRIFNAQASVAWSAWVRGRGTLDADWGGWHDELETGDSVEFDGAACFCRTLLRYLASSSRSQPRSQSTTGETDSSQRLAALSALNILVQHNIASTSSNNEIDADESLKRLRRVQQRAVEAALKTEVDLESGGASFKVDGVRLLLSLIGAPMRNVIFRLHSDVSSSDVVTQLPHAALPLVGSSKLKERKAALEVLRSVASREMLANIVIMGEQPCILKSEASSEPAWPKVSYLWQSFLNAAHAMMLHSDAVCAVSEAGGDATSKKDRVSATAANAAIALAALAAVCSQSCAWHTTTAEAGGNEQGGSESVVSVGNDVDASYTCLAPSPTHPQPVLSSLSKCRGGTFITALLAMVGAAPGCVAAAAPLRALVDPPPSIACGGPLNFAAGASEAAIEQARLEAAAEETARAAAASQTQSKDNLSTDNAVTELSQAPRLLACVLLARACAVRGTDGAASAGALQLRALLPLPLVHAIEAAAADRSAFGNQEGADAQHGAARRAIDMFDAETETVRFIWNKAARNELFARLRDDLVVSARAAVAAEIAALKAECSEPEAQPAAVSAIADAEAAAAVVRRELQRPLRLRCLSAELNVQFVYIRLLVAALNRGGGGAALRGIDSSELLDSMIKRFVSDANALMSGSSTHKKTMQMLTEACVGLLRARPALLHSGDAVPAPAHDDGEGPPKLSAGWRYSGALADVLARCTSARREGGSAAALDELSVINNGCRQLLLALAPSPHCAAALSARGLELESLLQQADDAITSVDVAADGMQRDEL